MSREWMDNAACTAVDVDPDIFFSTDDIDQARAKRICDTQCSVKNQCDLYRRRNSIRHGMWAGVMLRGEL